MDLSLAIGVFERDFQGCWPGFSRGFLNGGLETGKVGVMGNIADDLAVDFLKIRAEIGLQCGVRQKDAAFAIEDADITRRRGKGHLHDSTAIKLRG